MDPRHGRHGCATDRGDDPAVGHADLPAVGQADRSGATITAAHVRIASIDAVVDLLPSLASAASDPALQDPANREAALAARAQQIVAAESTLSVTTAPTVIGLRRMYANAAPGDPTAAPSPSASLRALRFTDADNWTYRALLSTAADNTPDAGGLRRFYDLHAQRTGGVTTTWGYGTSQTSQDDLHWNGSQWLACPLGTRGTVTAPDANGITRADYCNGRALTASRSADVDIAGQTLASVVTDIRTFPGGDSGVAYAQFGPANLSALGSAVFGPGSKLRYQSTASLANAYQYVPSTAIQFPNADVAAGGDARTSAPPCSAILATTPPDSYQSPLTTIEDLLARVKGTPCIFGQSTNANGTSLPTNEWWTQSTLLVGTINNGNTLPAGTGNYYTTLLSLRVGFTAPDTVTYYRCYGRTGDGSARNCTSAGTGKYAIETLGDARVLVMTDPPLLAAPLSYERIFVQRGGAVYYGYRNKAQQSQGVRLNLEAANGLFTQLGLTPLSPQ